MNTIMLCYLIWRLLARLPPMVPNPIAMLGRHSLPVFAFQILALYLLRPLFDESRDSAWWMAGGSLLLAILQFIPALVAEGCRNRSASDLNATRQNT